MASPAVTCRARGGRRPDLGPRRLRIAAVMFLEDPSQRLRAFGYLAPRIGQAEDLALQSCLLGAYSVKAHLHVDRPLEHPFDCRPSYSRLGRAVVERDGQAVMRRSKLQQYVDRVGRALESRQLRRGY